MKNLQHSDYMEFAITEATVALSNGEVPVGSVIVKDNRIIAYGHNTRETDNLATSHAEINAINNACKALKSWRLDGCSIYVTLEPCPMCMGAILSSRIDTIIFGSYDFKYGCCGSSANLSNLYTKSIPEIIGGIRELECNKLIENFFKNKREKA